MSWLASIPGGVLIATLVSDWIERHARKVQIYECIGSGRFRWIEWGHHYDRERYVGDFLIIRLPSYSWEASDYGRYFCWHRRVIYKRTGNPWRMVMERIYDQT